MKKGQIRTKRIIALASVTFFSLCANVLATIAWFTAQKDGRAENEYFEIEQSADAEIDSINLYKFEYSTTDFEIGGNTMTMYDYLTPETGEVKKYAFNYTEQKFGETVEGVFHPVTVMNIYDPVDRIISQEGFDLFTLNCSVIYEINFSSGSLTNCYMDVTSKLFSKTPGTHEILLSDCVDFDVFYAADLNDSRLANKAYYPTYKEDIADPSKTDTQELTAEEILYYKFSYLSKLIGDGNHINFYGTNPKPQTIELETNKSVTFSNDGKYTFYILANYAPDTLEQYSNEIYENNILALYDFNFITRFNESSGA